MSKGTNYYRTIAALFILIGLFGLVSALYFEAIAAFAMAVSFLLFAPPRSRAKWLAGYAFTAIALLSLLSWLVTSFK